MAVDSYFYGKLVIAPLNILLYNVFTPHGPDLYGNIEAHATLKFIFDSVCDKMVMVSINRDTLREYVLYLM